MMKDGSIEKVYPQYFNNLEKIENILKNKVKIVKDD
jgi:hypothetical protein